MYFGSSIGFTLFVRDVIGSVVTPTSQKRTSPPARLITPGLSRNVPFPRGERGAQKAVKLHKKMKRLKHKNAPIKRKAGFDH